METDKRAAPDRNPRRRTGHHVMVAGTMIALVVPYRPDDGKFVRDRSHLFHVLGIVNAADLGLNRLELAADFNRSQRLGVESLVVGRTAIQPNQNARVGLAILCPLIR